MIFNITLLSGSVPEGRVFAVDGQMLASILAQLFNACLLAAILGFILYKPVLQYMRRRTERITGQLDSARISLAEAEALKAEYQKQLNQIESQRMEVLEQAKAAAHESGRLILDEARAEAETIRLRAEEKAQEEQERLKEETRLYIIEVASTMAEKLVRRSVERELQNRLFDETLAELEEASWLS